MLRSIGSRAAVGATGAAALDYGTLADEVQAQSGRLVLIETCSARVPDWCGRLRTLCPVPEPCLSYQAPVSHIRSRRRDTEPAGPMTDMRVLSGGSAMGLGAAQRGFSQVGGLFSADAVGSLWC